MGCPTVGRHRDVGEYRPADADEDDVADGRPAFNDRLEGGVIEFRVGGTRERGR